MLICPNCGRELQAGVQFCAGCGFAPPPQQQWAQPHWPPSTEQQPLWAPPQQQQSAPPQQQRQWAPPQQNWAPQPQQWQEPPLGQPVYEPPPARPPRSPSRGPLLVIACSALLALAAVAAVIVFERVGHASGHAAPATTSTVVAGPQAAGTSGLALRNPATTTETVPPATTAAAPPTDEASAAAALRQQAAADHAAVEQLVGSWVPELSAKKLGLVANGVTYDYQAIWTDYEQQAAAHPGALLLRSDDYSNFKYAGFWITVVPQPYTTGAEANSWCDSQHIDSNNCYAERISHTGGSDGNTLYRN